MQTSKEIVLELMTLPLSVQKYDDINNQLYYLRVEKLFSKIILKSFFISLVARFKKERMFLLFIVMLFGKK